jgi:hypothetical protein
LTLDILHILVNFFIKILAHRAKRYTLEMLLMSNSDLCLETILDHTNVAVGLQRPTMNFFDVLNFLPIGFELLGQFLQLATCLL